MSLQYRIFLFMVFGICVLNLFTMNDFLPHWSQAEENAILGGKEIMFGGTPSNLPSLIVGALSFRWEEVGVLRLPGIIVLLLCMVTVFGRGRRIFGRDTMGLALVILASSFLIVNVAKFAASDVWLFAFQSLAVIFTILYLKQPNWKWNILHAQFTFLAALVSPISTLVLVLGYGLYLMYFHKNGKNLKGLYWWIPLYLIVFVFYMKGFPTFENYNPFFFAYDFSKMGNFLLWMVYGMLPWFAFLPAGLRHGLRRIKQREELAVILGGWLLFGLLSMSLTIQLMLSIMIAKQILGFFTEKYPYDKLVRAGAILHIVIAVLALTVLMIGGFTEMEAIGYRSMMVFGTIYWVLAIVGVLGIFMKNRKMILGGMAMSGLMAVFIFWVQVFPLLEMAGKI